MDVNSSCIKNSVWQAPASLLVFLSTGRLMRDNNDLNRRYAQPLLILFAAAVVSICYAGCVVEAQRTMPQPVRTISKSETTRLPVILVSNQVRDLQQTTSQNSLAVTRKEVDELPQGPEGFDAMPEGGFVLTDPLQNRLVLYNEEGGFRSARSLGFAADWVRAVGDNRFYVRRVSDGDYYVLEGTGEPVPLKAERSQFAEKLPARLIDANRGVISGLRRANGPDELQVEYKNDKRRLVSLTPIMSEDTQYVYVAIETAPTGSDVNVSKIIRKYALDGTLLAEIINISTDYYINPTEEFKVRRGVVYQLQPLRNEVRINRWNTN